MANRKTVRTELDPQLYQIYEGIRVRDDMNKQLFLLRIIKEWITALGVDLLSVGAQTQVVKSERKTKHKRSRSRKPKAPNPIAILNDTADNLARIHINVRQHDRFGRLCLLVAGCRLDVDKSIGKRDLLYPPDKEAEVRHWMSICPTGGKKKSGLEVTDSESTRGPYDTRSRKMFRTIMTTLSGQTLPMSIPDLHEVLKGNDCAPKGFSQKPDLRKFIEECPSIVFDKDNDICYLAKASPTLEETVSMQETIQASEKISSVEEENKSASLKVPSFFPKNWKPVG